MTPTAMSVLLEWAANFDRDVQANFALFYFRSKNSYAQDKSLGADGSGTINFQMMKQLINEFEVRTGMKTSFSTKEIFA